MGGSGGFRVEASTGDPRPRFTFRWGEELIEAREGDSIAAALLAAGIRVLRETPTIGQPRGLYCGMGVCFDCVVSIDGVPNQRACVVPARPGAVVRAQQGLE